MKFLKRIETVLAAITGAIAIMFLVFMMLGTSLDATMRFLFNRPISGVFELAELAMVICVFFGLGWAQQDRKHIRATMLIERFGPRGRAIADLIAWACSALLLLVLALPATSAAVESFSIREFRWGSMQLPIWWVKIILAAGLWLAFAQMLWCCIEAMRAAAASKAE